MSGCDEDVKIPGNRGPAGWLWGSDTMTHGQTPPSSSYQAFFSKNARQTKVVTNEDNNKRHTTQTPLPSSTPSIFLILFYSIHSVDGRIRHICRGHVGHSPWKHGFFSCTGSSIPNYLPYPANPTFNHLRPYLEFF